MTRFARAKGSKSSNSRSAEDATDWSEMKRPAVSPAKDSTTDYTDVVKKTIKKVKAGGAPKSSGWAEFDVPAAQTTSNKKGKVSNGNESNVSPKKANKRKKNKSVGDQEDEGAKKAKPSVPKKLETVEDSPSNGTNKKIKKSKNQSEQNSPPNGMIKKIKKDKFPNGNKSSVKPKSGIKLDDGTFKRRKPFVGSQTLSINGTTVKITKFDGFDIKHEDALRLVEIREKMEAEGIPKKEIDFAIKKERRNAEKALNRVKKMVCFNCRKSGHNLSDCPELDSGTFSAEKTGTTNICYKCGSTEHTHFQCQVKKTKEYSFATCFICKEQGHISSQCPDNPKGLYPKGGSCKVCGEVTHLKKDCPRLAKDRSENVVTLDTISSTSNVESLEAKPNTKPKKALKQKKVVKF